MWSKRNCRKAQALSDLRQQLGYESVPSEYDIAEELEYRAVERISTDLQAKALRTGPICARRSRGITAANSQYTLGQSQRQTGLHASGNYSHANGLMASAFLSVFRCHLRPQSGQNRSDTERHRASRGTAEGRQGQVLTDVRDAYVALQESAHLARVYRSGYPRWARKAAISVSTLIGRGHGAARLSWSPSELSRR